MLKSISAALIAASLLAAPAMAASVDKTATPPAKTMTTTGTKSADVKGGKVLNARASMHRHHHRHYSHHRTHKHFAGVKKLGRTHVVKAKSGVRHLSAVKSGKTRG